ncbi:sigma-70 family RNA polymerase sigma factor [Ruminococcaceae bacterium OttesenSCG-928-D13]|nr:sigma-70 family RNA polymerase sigma factor [Ruminococcaceae bacterium OttesenSCG-928-D13]
MDKNMLDNLISQAQSGNMEAQQALYMDKFKPVYYLALKMLRSHNDAEDMTQEVFITAFQNIAKLHNPQAFTSWLNQITANKCTSALRKKRELLGDEEDEAERLDLSDEDILVLPDGKLDDDETKRMILEVVDNLPTPQKLCVYYYYYEQLTIAQIAENLQCSEGTVKSRLTAARDKIRAELERKNREEGIRLYGVPVALMPILHKPMQEYQTPPGVEQRVWGRILSTMAASTPTGSSHGKPDGAAGAAHVAKAAGAAAHGGKKILIAAISVVAAAALTVAGVILIPRLSRESDATSSSNVQVSSTAPVVSPVKSEVEPPVPVVEASVEPGEYTEYQAVSLTSASGVVYYSLDGSVPTLEDIHNIGLLDDQYEPLTTVKEYFCPILTVGSGTTEIQAVCYMDDDSISEVYTFEYIISPGDYVINWVDPVVEAGIRQALGKPDGDIMRSELDYITSVSFSFSEVFVNEEQVVDNTNENKSDLQSLIDFQHFINLQGLSIYESNLSLLEGIEGVEWLRSVGIGDTNVTDYTPLAALEYLNEIFCGPLFDISVLSGKPLEHLALWGGIQVDSLDFVTEFANLEYFSIRESEIVDVGPLQQLPKLKTLALSGLPLIDLTPLRNMESLEALSLRDMAITDLSPLTNLNLKHLFILDLQVADISPLSSLSNLLQIALGNTPVSDLSPLSSLSNLKLVRIAGTEVTDFSPIDHVPDVIDGYAYMP